MNESTQTTIHAQVSKGNPTGLPYRLEIALYDGDNKTFSTEAYPETFDEGLDMVQRVTDAIGHPDTEYHATIRDGIETLRANNPET